MMMMMIEEEEDNDNDNNNDHDGMGMHLLHMIKLQELAQDYIASKWPTQDSN